MWLYFINIVATEPWKTWRCSRTKIGSRLCHHVTGMYAQIYADVTDGTLFAPDFRTALAARNLIDAIREAADSGQRTKLGHSPA
jgi:hypothetical protein